MKAAQMQNKVPPITTSFWAIKILSTTVGETGADTLAVNVGLGRTVTTSAMVVLLAIFLIVQLRARRYVPWLYWLVVILISIVGTQLTDALTDGLGVSLYLSTAAFTACLAATFAAWHAREHTLSIKHVDSLPRELFYWTAVLFTFALGTAAGDLATEALGLGFRWGTVAFGVAIALTLLAWKMGANEILAFWIAYILTRPFGAALGDLLSQAAEYGGVGLGPAVTSVIFLAVIVTLVGLEQRRSARSGLTPS
jgi:uncharacterized membrane-anchored protein